MKRTSLSVLQVSPADVGGGAEKVALDLHRRLMSRGVQARLTVARASHAEEPALLSVPVQTGTSVWTRTLLAAADRVGATRGAGNRGPRWAADRALRLAASPTHMARILSGLEDFDFPATRLLLDLPPTPPDVLHLHNLHGGYFDVRELPALASRVPTILTMHDAWLLTGHCVYPMECQGWRTACGTCPYLDRPIPIRRDRAADNDRIKRDALAGGRVHLAAPSRWLADMAAESGHASLAAEVRVIPNGVDTSVFCPGDRAAARERLGLPADALVVLFAARSATTSEFKGFETLEAALPAIAAGCAGRELLLLALGAEGAKPRTGSSRVRPVPFVDDPAAMAEHYRAADLYVHPARAESFGLAVLEAMACGTPVVASRVGGIPEVVEDGRSGLLFDVGDADALASAVLMLLRDGALRDRIAAAGAERARDTFPFDRQVDAYLAWYAELAGKAAR